MPERLKVRCIIARFSCASAAAPDLAFALSASQQFFARFKRRLHMRRHHFFVDAASGRQHFFIVT